MRRDPPAIVATAGLHVDPMVCGERAGRNEGFHARGFGTTRIMVCNNLTF